MRRSRVLNLHRGLAPGALSRRYRRIRDSEPAGERDEYQEEDCWYETYDDYWDPVSGRTADDFLILDALKEGIGFLSRKPRLGDLLPSSLGHLASGERDVLPAPETHPRRDPEELTEALWAHLRFIVSLAKGDAFISWEWIGESLRRNNGGLGGLKELIARFAERPAPAVMSLLFAPFWVRPLASFRLPQGDDAAITASLIEHLFVLYRVPRSLLRPWLDEGLPSLKWVLWLLLLGQGGNLHRAAHRFGWSIAKRFTHGFTTAPDDLTPLEACMWSEVVRLGGQPLDFDRVRRNPALVLDPTDAPDSLPEQELALGTPLSDDAWERRRAHEQLARTRTFWRETVEWLIKWREQLTDEMSAAILEWAVHLHTESMRELLPQPPFVWRGREPASSFAAARAYQQLRDTPYGNLMWRALGLDWEWRESESIVWTVRELTSGRALSEESQSMHHCVASYAYRCAQGHSAIFSLCANGTRRITIELEPTSRRIAQARGTCNRSATSEEQSVISRWLADLLT